jgi:hypothetical protein
MFGAVVALGAAFAARDVGCGSSPPAVAAAPEDEPGTGTGEEPPLETDCEKQCRVEFIDCTAACREQGLLPTDLDTCLIECQEAFDACSHRCTTPMEM